MPAFIVTLRGKKMRRMERRGERERERERNKEIEGEIKREKRVVEGDEWKSEREKERQGKRPQILFQVKGFLSRHLPCAREPAKIKMTSRNVFSLSLYFPSWTSWREPHRTTTTIHFFHFIFPPRTTSSWFHVDSTVIHAAAHYYPLRWRERNHRAEVAALEAHRSRWMKITPG